MKQNRRILALILAFCMALSLLTGCGNQQTNPQSSTSSAVESQPDASTPGTTDNTGDSSLAGDTSTPDAQSPDNNDATTSTYDYTVKMDVTNVDFNALSNLNNEAVPYGFSTTNRDDLNRPDGIYYYDSLYADYNGYTHIDTEEKTVYLTMDEGYENGCTPEILKTLKEKGVSAVFFITKQFYDENPDLIQQMIDEGHIVGNHTCSHPAGGMPQLGAQAEYEDIKQLNDLVYDKFGYQMKLFRFPEGVASPQSVALLDQMGYKSVFWSFAYRDFDTENQMDPDEALSQCLASLHPGEIFLLHAVSTTNTEILGDFIDGVREQGYEFGVFPVEDGE